MKVTFPHLSHTEVALKTLFAKHGVECIIPPKSSKRTLTLGVQHSPMELCLPYKVLLGNIIEGLEQGADTVINVAGPGLCRLGYYARLHEEVLRGLGYQFEMINFDWQEGQIVGLAKFIRRLLGNEKPWREILGDIKYGMAQLTLMDDIEKRVHWVRARELEEGTASRVWRTVGDRVAAAFSPAELKQLRRQIFGELDAIPLKPNFQPLQVAFLGEFFLAVDPFCNMDLEEELGKRGVEVTRHAYLMEWAKVWLFFEALGMSHGKKVQRAAGRYLRRDVSGDAVQSLGETILHQQKGFDGIVHIMPFTCMPEIVAQNIFPKLTKEYNIPVLSLVLDEQMGRSGILTRLEAFVDLMARRRARPANAGIREGAV